MKIVEKNDGFLYKADKNKMLKFKNNNDQKFSEIFLKRENNNIMEVDK